VDSCLWTAESKVLIISDHCDGQAVDKALLVNNEKKRSERRKHCTLAVVRRSQKFSLRRRPLPGGAGRPKFNQLEMVTSFTYKPSSVKIDARSFELSGNSPTNTHTHTHKHTNDKPTNAATDRTDYNTLRRS